MLLLARALLPARMSAADLMDEEGKVLFLTELTVCEGSRFAGKTLGDIKELNRTGVQLVALHRNGSSRRDLADHVLQAGDRIVIQASMPEVLTLHGERGFDILGVGGGESGAHHTIVEAVLAPGRGNLRSVRDMRLGRFGVRLLGISRHRYLPGLDLESVQLRAADRLLLEGTTEGLAVLGVALILLLRCIDAEEAWESINGGILVLIFAMLAIGVGLEKTGAVQVIVAAIEPMLGQSSGFVLLAVVYFLAVILTELITNNAVAVVLTPIASMAKI